MPYYFYHVVALLIAVVHTETNAQVTHSHGQPAPAADLSVRDARHESTLALKPLAFAQVTKRDGTNPTDEPPPVIYGEDIDEDCPIDIDIHLPAAQDPAQPLVPEGRDLTEGAWTLRNDDMDATTAEIIGSRLQNPADLNAAEGKPDFAMAGAAAAENDLVAVDLHNPNNLANVFLNVYAMAAQTQTDRVLTHANQQLANQIARRLVIWRNPNRTGPVTLPLQVAGRDRIWVEGLAAGRYRLVLLFIQNGTLAQAQQVKATEAGPHGRVTAGNVTLHPPKGVAIECFKHVRLTVAVADIFQQSRREHLFDVLWGGRPVFDGRLWPVPGTYTWEQTPGFAGAWLDGTVHGAAVASTGPAAGGMGRIQEVHGAFESTVQAIGQRIQGSGRYEHRVRLRYQVEGVNLVREEPVTLMVPDHLVIHPLPPLSQGINMPHWGTTYEFALKARYELFEQHDRKLVGPSADALYSRQYGTRLQAYEALGMGLNARENNDEVQWRYVSPINPNRHLTINIDTKQRRHPIPSNRPLSEGEFTDSFYVRINNTQRGMLQADIVANNALASGPVFRMSQDIVMLLRNGEDEYDVRVARGQRLDILAPQARPAAGAPWGGMGFRMTLGGAGGAQLDTGNPDRVTATHNPPPPP